MQTVCEDPIEAAIYRIAADKGYTVIRLPNDCWDLHRNGSVKTKFSKHNALEWLNSQR